MAKDNFIKKVLERTGKDTLIYLPTKLVPAVLGFVSIAVITRLLSPSEYGLYNIVLATVNLTMAFGLEWIKQPTLRFYKTAKNEGLLEEHITTAFALLFLTILVIWLFWFPLTQSFGDRFSSTLQILFIFGAFFLMAKVFYSLNLVTIRAGLKSSKYSVYSIAKSVLRFLLVIVFLYLINPKPEYVILATIISSLLFGLIIFFRNNYDNISSSSFSLDRAKRFFFFGVPFIGAKLGAVVLSLSDRYLIGWFLGSEATGIYSAGYKLPQKGLSLIYSLLILSTYPIVIDVFENKGEVKSKRYISKALNIYMVVAVPAVFGLIVLRKELVDIVLGSNFVQSSLIIPYVSVGVFFLGLTQFLSIPFQLKEETKYFAYFTGLAAVINLALNYFLIPMIGVSAAAMTTAISYLVLALVTGRVSRNYIEWSFPWKSTAKYLIASLVMFLFLTFITLPLSEGFILLFIKIVIGIVIYFVTLLLTRDRLTVNVIRVLTEYLNEFIRENK